MNFQTSLLPRGIWAKNLPQNCWSVGTILSIYVLDALEINYVSYMFWSLSFIEKAYRPFIFNLYVAFIMHLANHRKLLLLDNCFSPVMFGFFNKM